MNERPRIVEINELGCFSNMRARLGFFAQYGNLFHGYCKRHRIYFLDLKHTNDVIRCPVCDEAWLRRWIPNNYMS